MDHDFWLRLWENNHIPFHEGVANAMLAQHFDALSLTAPCCVFVPLCGKTRDIAWLLSRGHAVIGCDLSPLAVTQLFAELGVVPDISTAGPLQRFAAPGVVVYAGDIFDLEAKDIRHTNAVYDRAALIALPPDLRLRYARHLTRITGKAPQLLISFEHARSDWDGPPHAVGTAELEQLYGADQVLTLLDRIAVIRGPDADPTAFDTVWLLR